MNILESIYGILFKPQITLQEIKQTENFYRAIFILLLIIFINSLYISNSFFSSILMSISMFISVLFLGLFISMFTALGSNFLGGNASIKDTLEIFIYATIPFIFLPIFSLFFITKFFLFVWFFIIFIIGLKQLNNFSTVKSIMSIFSIFGLLSLISSLFFFVIILSLIASFV